MQLKYKIGIGVVGLLILAGLFLPLGNSPIRLGALPVFQTFQLTSPTGYGIVTSNGIATSTLMGSSTPTVKSLTATSSLRLSNQTGGCAQFDSSGVITSTGSNCASQATGKTINMYAATTSVNVAANNRPATTTSITAGESLLVWASCTISVNTDTVNSFLDIHYPNGGTTTISFGKTITSGDEASMVSLHGLYTATTTGNLFVAIDSTQYTTISTACQNYNFTFMRFAN